MAHGDDGIHIEDDDAMAAVSNTGMRWVLAIGLLLAIVFLSAIWMFGALSQGEVEERATVSGTQDAIADRGEESNVLIPEIDEGPVDEEAAPAE